MGSASHNARSRWAGAPVCYGLLYACNACNAWRGAGVLVALMERVRCAGAALGSKCQMCRIRGIC